MTTREQVIARAIKQMNQPPQQRYTGPEAIARRDAVLQSRKVERPVITGSIGSYVLTKKDLGT